MGNSRSFTFSIRVTNLPSSLEYFLSSDMAPNPTILGFWIQDFPKGSGPGSLGSGPGSLGSRSDFQQVLEDYLSHVGETKFLGILGEYDFSEAKGKLISSVPGSHYGNKYGHAKLREELNQIRFNELGEGSYYKNVAQFTSVGSISGEWIEEFEVSLKSCKKLETKYVWPSVTFVSESIGGYMNGGTLHLNSTNYKPFLTNLLKTFISIF